MRRFKYKEVEIAKALIFLFLVFSFTYIFSYNPSSNLEEISTNSVQKPTRTDVVINQFNHNKKGNYKSKYKKQKNRNRRNKLYFDKAKVKRECKLMIIKYNKISSHMFEDRYYLKYPLTLILSDKSFKLLTTNDLEDLHREYFSEEIFEVSIIEKNFNDYVINSIGLSVAEEKFFEEIRSIKIKYYMFNILKEIYEKGNYYKEYKIEDIIDNRGFLQMFNFTEYTIEAKNFIKNNKLSWTLIDEILEKIIYKIKSKTLLEKEEKNFIESSVLLKRLYMFLLNQEEEVKAFKINYKDIFTIIKDYEFLKIIPYKNIEINAKRLIKGDKDRIDWIKVDKLIRGFFINKIMNNNFKKDRITFNALQYFFSLQQQYRNFLSEKNKTPKSDDIIRLCDKGCVGLCKYKSDKINDYLKCAKETCKCSEYEVLNIEMTNQLDDKEKGFGLTSYICIILSAIIFIYILYHNLRNNLKFIHSENSEITYELLTENESEIRI